MPSSMPFGMSLVRLPGRKRWRSVITSSPIPSGLHGSDLGLLQVILGNSGRNLRYLDDQYV